MHFRPGCRLDRLQLPGTAGRNVVTQLLSSRATASTQHFVLAAAPVPKQVQRQRAARMPNGEVPPVMVQTVAFKKYCGKKAVVRNNVRRRLKAAARLVFPAHAARDHMYLVSARALAVLAPNEALVHEMAGCLQQLRLYSNHDLLGAGVTALGSVPLVDGRAAHATSLTDAVARGTDDSDGDGDDLGYSTDGDFDFSDYGDDDW